MRLMWLAVLLSRRTDFVAMPGTTVTNWIEDFRFWNTPVPFSWCKGCYVEAGFSSIWHSVKDEVQLKLGQMGCVPVNQRASVSSTSNLYITGSRHGTLLKRKDGLHPEGRTPQI